MKLRSSHLSALLFTVVVSPIALAQSADAGNNGKAEVLHTAHMDQLPSLKNLAPKAIDPNFQKPAKPKKRVPYEDDPAFVVDQRAQLTHLNSAAQGGSVAAAVAGNSFEGMGQGFSGPQGQFQVQYAPPDTTGAVGSSQYVQWVNTSFAIFDKATGAPVYGPVAANTLFSGFGGACETSNDGDPVVLYDRMAGRWILMQFAVPNGGPYYQCIAVSKTSDATGAYYRYAFQYSGFNDYPKAGIWPDAYYVTYNMFSGNSFSGAKACAMDRAKMLAGDPGATQQCVQLGSAYGGLLPSDLDGTTLPPAGSPNYVMNLGTSKLNLWKFHVDWTTPTNTTLSGPTAIPVSSFAAACGGGTCIPQAGTNQQLDSLADRLMYRLAYRNFGSYEAVVVNHAVKVGGNSRKTQSSATRWYEVRNLSGTPSVYQQSSYAPDNTSRWMGSIAMDKLGNIALGYSASSSAIKPAIRYASRAAGDTANTLSNETVIIQGSGAQTNTLSRWGDYSTMTLDPTDDCTFWYTSEYLKSDGKFNWSTRINSFKMANCS